MALQLLFRCVAVTSILPEFDAVGSGFIGKIAQLYVSYANCSDKEAGSVLSVDQVHLFHFFLALLALSLNLGLGALGAYVRRVRVTQKGVPRRLLDSSFK